MTEDAKEVLTRIEASIAVHAKALDDHVAREEQWQARADAQLRAIDSSLRGNGEIGLNTRIDRLEQQEKGRARLLWIAVTAASGSLYAWAASHWK